MSTWSETHGFAKPRSKLTARAVAWAVDGSRHDDTTVSALARHLGVDWHTAWNAIEVEAGKRVERPERVQGVPRSELMTTLGGPGCAARTGPSPSWSTSRARAAGQTTAEQLLETLHTCPVPEVARLGRTLRQWRTEILAYFPTGGVSNGGTEAVNVVIEETRRLAHGFGNFTNCGLRILLAADGTRPYRDRPTHA